MCINLCTYSLRGMEVSRHIMYAIFIVGLVPITANSHVLEAEDAVLFEGKQIMSRSEASGQLTLKMYKGHKVSLEFCLTKNSDIEVQNVWYSNDGQSDLVTLSLDNKRLGELLTEPISNNGAGWNIFKSSGHVGSIVYLLEGVHQLTFYIENGDEYGVEIDKVDLLLHSDKEESSLDCNVFCFDDISYNHDCAYSYFDVSTSKGKLVQKSKPTLCAEEDNVNLHMFHDSARKYIISANLPQYKSFANNRMPDWKNCKMARALWSFRDIDLSETQKVTQASADATVSVTVLHPGKKSSWITYVVMIEFSLDGPSIGTVDSEIGSIINVSFNGIQNVVHISLQYFDRLSQWSESHNTTIYSNKTWCTWKIPDLAWREGSLNSVRLTITASTRERIQIREIVMNKRDQRMDQFVMVYNDGMTIIEVVDVDAWWRGNETMALTTLNNGRVFQGVDYFRIYRKIPWSDKDFCQVFVMYEDGNVRLLPITPHGLDWIPFGSSILIGQSDPMAVRPAAPVRHAVIDPKELTIQVTFFDGGSLSLKLVATIKQTIVIASDAVYARSLSSYPFLTFRSMWVANGNSDVDHVSVDGNEPHAVLSGWSTLRGTSFAFFRKCISKHNTLSPDLKVQITE